MYGIGYDFIEFHNLGQYLSLIHILGVGLIIAAVTIGATVATTLFAKGPRSTKGADMAPANLDAFRLTTAEEGTCLLYTSHRQKYLLREPELADLLDRATALRGRWKALLVRDPRQYFTLTRGSG